MAVFIVFLSSSVLSAANFPQLLITIEHYTPCNFKEDGLVQGIAVDMMIKMQKKLWCNSPLFKGHDLYRFYLKRIKRVGKKNF